MSVRLRWTMPSGAVEGVDFDSFYVYRADDENSEYTYIGEADLSKDSEGYYGYTDTTGTDGNAYYVTAVNVYSIESRPSPVAVYHDVGDDLCVLYADFREPDGDDASGTAYLTITELPYEYQGAFWSGQRITQSYTGRLEIAAPRLATVRLVVPYFGIDDSFTVPNQATADIGELI